MRNFIKRLFNLAEPPVTTIQNTDWTVQSYFVKLLEEKYRKELNKMGDTALRSLRSTVGKTKDPVLTKYQIKRVIFVPKVEIQIKQDGEDR